MRPLYLLSVATLGVLLAMPSVAQPGKGHGQGGGGGGPPPHAQGGGGPGAGNPGRGGGPDNVVVQKRDRDTVYSYYRTEYAAGNCPPGLAKKNNGCLPPGQAKKMWTVGQPLPRGVLYDPLPPVLLGRLTPVPAGYQYVRVANDILLLVVGTRMVTSAIADLSRF